jgi:hypothetical protein
MNESIMYRFNEEERVSSAKDPRLIEADIQARDSDPFGSVSGGSIKIEALVKAVQCTTHWALEKVVGYIEPKHWLSSSTFSGLPIYVFSEDGTHIGTGCFDRPLESPPHLCKAVRIAERSYERQPFWTDDGEDSDYTINRRGPIKQNVIYFLLVQPDDMNEGGWKRVGVGMTRNIAQRQHYPDPFDLRDWEKLRLF